MLSLFLILRFENRLAHPTCSTGHPGCSTDSVVLGRVPSKDSKQLVQSGKVVSLKTLYVAKLVSAGCC